MDHGSPDLAPAEFVHRRHVPANDVARYYLRCELPNVVPVGDDPAVAAALEAGVAGLPAAEVWRLLEALSFRFRLNPVFASVSDEGLDWHEVRLPVAEIVMTGVMPTVDDIVYSAEIGRSPLRFAGFLTDYFAQHPGDDPLGLAPFRPRGGAVALDTLLVERRPEGPAMLDGTHRLLEYAQQGVGSVRAFYGVPNGRTRRPMAGDSAFYQLRDLYARHRARGAEAAAILTTAGLLLRDSADGRSAVETYWVRHARDPALKEAGARLLAAFDGGEAAGAEPGDP